MKSKTCRACHLEKPATADYFRRRPVNRDGLDNRCLQCDRRWRDGNRDTDTRHPGAR